MTKNRAVQPDGCPDEVWESMQPAAQQRAPASVEVLWGQWSELQRVVSHLDSLVGQLAKSDGKVVSRVSIMLSKGRDMEVMVIFDGDQGKKSYAAFHRGGVSAFAALAHASWRVHEGEADWRERKPGASKDESGASSAYTSGAF